MEMSVLNKRNKNGGTSNFVTNVTTVKKTKVRKEGYVPLFIDRIAGSNLPELSMGKKFLFPQELTLIHLRDFLRKQMRLKAEEALFIFIPKVKGGYVIPLPYETFADLHKRYKWDDEILYISYSMENTFGAVRDLN